jgi:general stress protein 26
MKPNAKAKAVLDAIDYATLATVTKDGDPWNTPLAAFRFNDDYTFYWASWQNNHHSQNIRANGKAFIAVYDSTPANG